MQSHLSSDLAVVWVALLLGACAPEGEVSNIPEPGIPIALAEERAEMIRDLRYEVSFDIPGEVTEPINGRVTARFALQDASGPLVFGRMPA